MNNEDISTQKSEHVQQKAHFKLPVKRTTGDTVKERLTENAHDRILPARYLLKNNDGEVIESPREMFERVAKNVAEPDKEYDSITYEESWKEFFELMSSQQFMPNSPTLMNAGASLQQLSACFVVHPEDNMESIFGRVKDAARIFQSGGGMGYPFHLLRPKGDRVKSTGGIASGPLSFQRVFDTTCSTIKQGGCLSQDSRVMTTEGYIPLGELHNGRPNSEVPVKALVKTREGFNQAVQTHESGVMDVHTIITEDGYELKAVYEHPVLSANDQGELVFKRVDELNEGDVIVYDQSSKLVNLRQPLQSVDTDYHHNVQVASNLPTKVTDRFATFLGLLRADGTFDKTNNRIIFSLSKNRKEKEWVQETAEKWGLRAHVADQQPTGKGDYWKITIQSKHLIEWMETNNVEKDINTVPECIYRSPIAIPAFLGGLTADATTLGDAAVPSYSTASTKTAQNIQELLLLCGISSKITYVPPQNDRYSDNESYRVTVSPGVPAKRFAETIPHFFTDPISTDGGERQNKVYFAQNLVKRVLEEYFNKNNKLPEGVDKKAMKELRRYERGERIPSRKRLVTMLERVGIEDVPELAENHLFQRIKYNEQDDTAPIADIEIMNGAHEFIASNAVVHNKRRGAQMGIMKVDHPDILRFVTAKRKEGQLSNFNISVGLTDKFMQAVKNDEDYELINPRTNDVFEVSQSTAEFYNKDEKWYPTARGSDSGVANNFWRDFAPSFGDEVKEFDIELQPGEPMKLPARFIWEALIDGAWRNGEPGLFMYDETNKMHSFDVEKYPEHRIEATNPCVTADTKISTKQGVYTAKELCDQRIGMDITVDGRLSDEPFKPASSVFKTGEKDVYKIQTKEGYSLRLTAKHRVMTSEGWKETQELDAGDTVHILNRKGGFGVGGTEDEGHVLGWLVGDGQIKHKEQRAVLHFYDADTELSEAFATKVNTVIREPQGNGSYTVGVQHVETRGAHRQALAQEQRIRSTRLFEVAESYGLVKNKLQVPEKIFRGSEELARGFLQALFTADGSVQGTPEKGVSVRLSSSTLPLLEDVQELLLNFGIYSRVHTERRKAGMRELPDGKGGMKEYAVKAQHELIISKDNVARFDSEIGFMREDKQAALEEKLQSYTTGPYKESFTATVEEVAHDGHEAVYDLTEPETHSFIANGIVIHNCGEQPLENYEACNLGHINLSLLVEDKGDGIGLNFHEWKENNVMQYDFKTEKGLQEAMQMYLQEALDMRQFEHVARSGLRFLDNVVTMSDFPLEQIDNQVGSLRKVGLGLMGFAQMLIQLGIRYGSDESVAAAKEIQRLITRISVAESHRLAGERGAFSQWNKSKWADPTSYPEWFRQYTGGLEPSQFVDGLRMRNHNTTTIAPTGCVDTSTMISTTEGLREIQDFKGTSISTTWSETSISKVQSDKGVVETTRHFDNGVADVETIVTDEGFEVTSTPNHRFRVIDEEGVYTWREASAIETGDSIVLQRNTIEETHVPTPLNTSEADKYHHNTNSDLNLPEEMTSELAEFLGYYMGDGYVHMDVGVKLVVEATATDLRTHLEDLGESVFGVKPAVEDRGSRIILSFGGRHLPRYFEANGWCKDKGNTGEGAASAFIPSQVMQSGREPAKAFLRGLFEADGTCPRKVELSTVSETLSKQVQTLLLALGIVFKREEKDVDTLGEDHYGNRNRFVVRGLNKVEDKQFLDEIGFITKKPHQDLDISQYSHKGDAFPQVLVEELVQSEGFTDAPKDLKHRIRQSRYQSLTKQSAIQALQYVQAQKVKHLVENEFFIGTVSTKQKGVARTHDIEVPENHTYISNGFISHNTTSMIANTSGGCEPIFSLAYFKNVAKDIQGDDMLVEFDDYFIKALEANDVDVERVKRETQDLMEKNKWEGVESIPDDVLPTTVKEIFTTANRVTAKEHIDIQAAFQAHNHSGISKTCNFPNEATKEDVREAYMRSYDKGVKGMTVYRDGTREVQVMQTNKDNQLTDMDKVDMLAKLVSEFGDAESLVTSTEFKEVIGETDLTVEETQKETQPVQSHTGNEAFGESTSMSKTTRKRPKVINGTTQEIKTPYGDVFVTINNDDHGPFEVFAQIGKAGGYTQSFTEALGRSISLALRNGADPEDVIRQLEDIRSPKIAYDQGTKIHSVPDAVAVAMRRHLHGVDTGQAPLDEYTSPDDGASTIVAKGSSPECPDCGGMLALQEGCKKCPSCGWSEC